MKKYTFVLLSWVFLMARCHKEEIRSDTTTVQGYVYEHNTTKPLKNAAIWVVGSVCTSLGSSCSYEAIEGTRTTTDSTGFFKLSFKHDGGQDYEMRGKYEGYKLGKFDDILMGKTNDMAITFFPPAWVKVHVKNVNPVDNQDEIYLDGLGFSVQSFYGQNVDIVRTTRAYYSNTHEMIGYEVIKGGIKVRKFKDDTIYIKGNDTTNINIYY